LFEQLLMEVFQAHEVKLLRDAVEKEKKAVNEGLTDESLKSEFHFHAASGKRLTAAQDFWHDANARVDLYIFTKILQPLFFLTHWLLKWGKDLPDEVGLPPPFVLFTSPSLSPVVAVLQHFSGMLTDNVHAKNLGYLTGAATMEQFMQNKTLLRKLRSFIIVAAAWTWFRHWHRSQQWPWRLVTLVDSKRVQSERDAVARQCAFGNRCCIGRFAFVLQQKLTGGSRAAEDLFSPLWQRRLLGFFRTIRLQTAPMEDKHARNKKHNNDKVSWANFAAKFVIAESKQVMRNALEFKQKLIEAADTAGRPMVAEAAVRRDSLSQMVRSAIQLFHQDQLDEAKSTGRKVQPASKEFWAEVRAAWEKLPDAKRGEYQEKYDELARQGQSARKVARITNTSRSATRNMPGRLAIQDSQESVSASASSSAVAVAAMELVPVGAVLGRKICISPSPSGCRLAVPCESLNLLMDAAHRGGQMVVLGAGASVDEEIAACPLPEAAFDRAMDGPPKQRGFHYNAKLFEDMFAEIAADRGAVSYS
jgi:hypothetical protein